MKSHNHNIDIEFQPFNLPPNTNSPEEEKMKRKLKFFFMNPKDKYIATKQIPWKLMLQILKVFLVTTQLVIFAEYRYAHVNYYSDQTIAFEHFFIKDWDQVAILFYISLLDIFIMKYFQFRITNTFCFVSPVGPKEKSLLSNI